MPTSPITELDALVHQRISGYQRLEDRARLEFLKHLAVLDDGKRYLELGYASTRHYLMQEFNVGRSNALELIRVARKLHELPRCADALNEGEIRWTALKAVSRIATTETESKWLDFASKHTPEQLHHEVKRATQEQRNSPIEEANYGLSNIMSRVSFEVTLEEKERFHTALARVGDAMGDGAPTDVASVLLFLTQKILEDGDLSTVHGVDGCDVDGNNMDGTESAPRSSALAVVYQQCPDCAASSVASDDGPVRVDPEVVDRLADVAEATTISAEELQEPEPLAPGVLDVPKSSSLARKIRNRDGQRCANPSCERRQPLHAHHIQFRSHGGRTTLSNEVTLCRTCHTPVHAGLVKIHRAPAGELHWTPRIRDFEKIPAFDPFPAFQQTPPLTGPEPKPSTAVDDARADAAAGIDLDALAHGLATLGYTKGEAQQRLQVALLVLGGEGDAVVDEGALLAEAMRIPA